MVRNTVSPERADARDNFIVVFSTGRMAKHPPGRNFCIRFVKERELNTTIVNNQSPVHNFSDSHGEQGIRIKTETTHPQAQFSENVTGDFVRVAGFQGKQTPGVSNAQVLQVAYFNMQEGRCV